MVQIDDGDRNDILISRCLNNKRFSSLVSAAELAMKHTS